MTATLDDPLTRPVLEKDTTHRVSRVLVTGSRDWPKPDLVVAALEQAWVKLGSPMVVVHGHCREGADAAADEWAVNMQGFGISVERHPAKGHPTQDFGPWPGAGPRRNAHMVSLGADVCLAFLAPCTSPRCNLGRVRYPHYSHGADGCAKLAQAAGIPVRRWYA